MSFALHFSCQRQEDREVRVAASLHSVLSRDYEVNADGTMQNFRERYRGTVKQAFEVSYSDIVDGLSFPSFSIEHRSRIATSHPTERPKREIRQRTRSTRNSHRRGAAARHHDDLDRAERGLGDQQSSTCLRSAWNSPRQRNRQDVNFGGFARTCTPIRAPVNPPGEPPD